LKKLTPKMLLEKPLIEHPPQTPRHALLAGRTATQKKFQELRKQMLEQQRAVLEQDLQIMRYDAAECKKMFTGVKECLKLLRTASPDREIVDPDFPKIYDEGIKMLGKLIEAFMKEYRALSKKAEERANSPMMPSLEATMASTEQSRASDPPGLPPSFPPPSDPPAQPGSPMQFKMEKVAVGPPTALCALSLLALQPKPPNLKREREADIDDAESQPSGKRQKVVVTSVKALSSKLPHTLPPSQSPANRRHHAGMNGGMNGKKQSAVALSISPEPKKKAPPGPPSDPPPGPPPRVVSEPPPLPFDANMLRPIVKEGQEEKALRVEHVLSPPTNSEKSVKNCPACSGQHRAHTCGKAKDPKNGLAEGKNGYTPNLYDKVKKRKQSQTNHTIPKRTAKKKKKKSADKSKLPNPPKLAPQTVIPKRKRGRPPKIKLKSSNKPKRQKKQAAPSGLKPRHPRKKLEPVVASIQAHLFSRTDNEGQTGSDSESLEEPRKRKKKRERKQNPCSTAKRRKTAREAQSGSEASSSSESEVSGQDSTAENFV